MVPWPSSRALSSGDRVMVEVRSHGSDGDITAWTQLEIEAGLLNPAAWSAAPITCEAQPIDQPRRPFRTAASFEAPARLSSARLYITALGLYEAHINGVRIGDEYLAPGWTSYHHRLVYRTFDVTDKVAPGKLNVLGSWVGEGWYTGRLAFRGGVRNNYGQRPALIAQLVIDGKIVLSTDATWKWSYGPLLTSELLNGEVYDTRLADGAWCMPEKFSSVAWSPVKVLEMPSTSLESTQAPPVRVIEEINSCRHHHNSIGQSGRRFRTELCGHRAHPWRTTDDFGRAYAKTRRGPGARRAWDPTFAACCCHRSHHSRGR
jgi:alpha-L-rhamnosidase